MTREKNQKVQVSYPQLILKDIRDVRVKKTRSKSRESKPDDSLDFREWGLTPDSKYSVFTTREQSNLVVVSEVPVKGSVIQEQLIDAKDL